jgi:hypothetical protein
MLDASKSIWAPKIAYAVEGLREEMRKSWDMPEESLFKYSRPDWLLVLLAGIINEEGTSADDTMALLAYKK